MLFRSLVTVIDQADQQFRVQASAQPAEQGGTVDVAAREVKGLISEPMGTGMSASGHDCDVI